MICRTFILHLRPFRFFTGQLFFSSSWFVFFGFFYHCCHANHTLHLFPGFHHADTQLRCSILIVQQVFVPAKAFL